MNDEFLHEVITEAFTDELKNMDKKLINNLVEEFMMDEYFFDPEEAFDKSIECAKYLKKHYDKNKSVPENIDNARCYI